MSATHFTHCFDMSQQDSQGSRTSFIYFMHGCSTNIAQKVYQRITTLFDSPPLYCIIQAILVWRYQLIKIYLLGWKLNVISAFRKVGMDGNLIRVYADQTITHDPVTINCNIILSLTLSLYKCRVPLSFQTKLLYTHFPLSMPTTCYCPLF